MTRFSDRLRRMMAERNYNNKELAAKLSIPSSSMSDYLTGKYSPSLGKVLSFSRTLGVSCAFLLGYESEENGKTGEAGDSLENKFSERFSLLLESFGEKDRENGTKAFSLATGIRPFAIKDYLEGKKQPHVDTVEDISSYFNVHPGWLLGLDGYTKDEPFPETLIRSKKKKTFKEAPKTTESNPPVKNLEEILVSLYDGMKKINELMGLSEEEKDLLLEFRQLPGEKRKLIRNILRLCLDTEREREK